MFSACCRRMDILGNRLAYNSHSPRNRSHGGTTSDTSECLDLQLVQYRKSLNQPRTRRLASSWYVGVHGFHDGMALASSQGESRFRHSCRGLALATQWRPVAELVDALISTHGLFTSPMTRPAAWSFEVALLQLLAKKVFSMRRPTCQPLGVGPDACPQVTV